jgi:O-methyltransferase involved in polyketide biosynthesis
VWDSSDSALAPPKIQRIQPEVLGNFGSQDMARSKRPPDSGRGYGGDRLKINVHGLTPVEQTALLTLYARALDSRCRRPILLDSSADDVAGRLTYDFDALRVPASVRCPVALRAKMLDERIGRFTTEHPEAVVVDLGAGLDNRFERCRPLAMVDWYNVDLPAVIALRDAVLPPRRQEHSVAARIGDLGWVDAIPADRPTMLVADGLTGFLSESMLVNFFQTVTDHFRTGELAFNDYGRVGRVSRTAMKLVPQPSVKAFGPNWANPGFADARRPEEWNPRLTLVEETSLAAAPEVELFPLHLRLLSQIGRHIPALARRARILRYRF